MDKAQPKIDPVVEAAAKDWKSKVYAQLKNMDEFEYTVTREAIEQAHAERSGKIAKSEFEKKISQMPSGEFQHRMNRGDWDLGKK